MEKKKCCLKCALFWRKHKCEHDGEGKKANGCFWERIKEYAVVFEEIIFKTISVKPHERIYRDILDWWYLFLFVCGYFYQILLLYVFFFFGEVRAEWFKSVPLVEWLGQSWFWMKILMPFLCTSYAVDVYMLIVSAYGYLNAKSKILSHGAGNGGNGNGGNGNGSGGNGNGKNGGNGSAFKKERGGTWILVGWILTFVVMAASPLFFGNYEQLEITESGPFIAVVGITLWSVALFIITRIGIMEKLLASEKSNPPENNKDKKSKK